MKKPYFQMLIAPLILSMLFIPSSYAAQYEYDTLGRLIQVAYDTGQTLQYTYDDAGNILTIEDNLTQQLPPPPWGIPAIYNFIENPGENIDRTLEAMFENADGSVELIYKEELEIPGIDYQISRKEHYRIVYRKQINGAWQSPIYIEDTLWEEDSEIDYNTWKIEQVKQVDNGDIHIIYSNLYQQSDVGEVDNQTQLHYAQISNSTLTAKQQISNSTTDSRYTDFTVTDGSTVHVVWREHDYKSIHDNEYIGTYYRTGKGNNWEAITQITEERVSIIGISTQNDQPFILYKKEDQAYLIYKNGNVWSSPLLFSEGEKYLTRRIKIFANAEGSYDMFYSMYVDNEYGLYWKRFTFDTTTNQVTELKTQQLVNPPDEVTNIVEFFEVLPSGNEGYHVFYLLENIEKHLPAGVYHFYFDGSYKHFEKEASFPDMYVPNFSLIATNLDNQISVFFRHNKLYRNEADYSDLIANLGKQDTDNDGIPDATDTDDDNDGIPDDYENQYAFLNPLDATDATADEDQDGYTNLAEYQNGTDPSVSDTTTATTGCNGNLQLPDSLCEELVAYFPLDNSPVDASGNGYDGTEYNVNYATGVVGNALSLDGRGYIRRANLDLTLENFAVALWIHASSLPELYRNPFAIHSGGDGRAQGDKAIKIHHTASGAKLYGMLTTEDGQIVGSASDKAATTVIENIQANQWYHVALVREVGGLHKLYINGVRANAAVEKNVTDQFSIENGFLEIGAPNFYEGGWTANRRDEAKWQGLIDEVYIYNRQLSDAEVQTLYAAGGLTTPPPTGCNGETQLPANLCTDLIAHYPLDNNVQEASGNAPDGNATHVTAIADRTGNANGALLFGREAASQVTVSNIEGLRSYPQFTAMAWVKNQEGGAIVSQFSGCPNGAPNYKGTAFMLEITNDDKVQFIVKSGTGNFYEADNRLKTNATVPQDDQWYLIAATFDAGELSVYINGEQDSASTVYYDDGDYVDGNKPAAASSQFSLMADVEEQLTIGVYYSWCGGTLNTSAFQGAIDEVLLYKRVLAEAEIQAFYNAANPVETVDNFTLAKQGYGISSIRPYGTSDWTINCKAPCPEASHQFPLDTELELTAYPHAGSKFTGWQCDNGLISNERRWRFTLDAPTTCTVSFALPENDPQYPTFTGKAIGEGTGSIIAGSIDLGKEGYITHPLGRNLWVKAKPANDFSRFKQWLGDCTGSKSPVKIVMDDDKTCSAEFVSVFAEVSDDVVAQLYQDDRFATQYPQAINQLCLQEAMHFATIIMPYLQSHLQLEGKWPQPFSGIDWYPPPITIDCIHSLKIMETLEYTYLQVQVYLQNANGQTELVNMQAVPPLDETNAVTDWEWHW